MTHIGHDGSRPLRSPALAFGCSYSVVKERRRARSQRELVPSCTSQARRPEGSAHPTCSPGRVKPDREPLRIKLRSEAAFHCKHPGQPCQPLYLEFRVATEYLPPGRAGKHRLNLAARRRRAPVADRTRSGLPAPRNATGAGPQLRFAHRGRPEDRSPVVAEVRSRRPRLPALTPGP